MHACLTSCTAGDGSLANELLPRTKGHGMGYGFVSLSFGIAFFFSILCFGYISAYMVGQFLPQMATACVLGLDCSSPAVCKTAADPHTESMMV